MPAGMPYGNILSINAHGNMAGYVFGDWGPGYPVAWINGKPLILDTRGDGAAFSINASGVVVGYQHGPDMHGNDNAHAMRWTADGATRLDPPEVGYSVAYAINDHGTITGDFYRTDGEHYTQGAFVWTAQNGWQELPPVPVADTYFASGKVVRDDGVVFGTSWWSSTHLTRWQPDAQGTITGVDILPLSDLPSGWYVWDMHGGTTAGTLLVIVRDSQGRYYNALLSPITPTRRAGR